MLTAIKKNNKVFHHLPANIINNVSLNDRKLFGYMASLIYEIAALTIDQDPSQDFDQISRQYLFSLLEDSPAVVGFLDLNFNFQMASNKFTRIVKEIYKIEDDNFTLINKNLNDMFPDIPAQIQESLQDNLKGKSTRHEQIKIYHPFKDGAWICWESFPWYGQNGNILGIVMFCEDVTSTQELLLNSRKLYSRTELLENFSLIFSHDLIQPLRQISTYTSFLEMDLEETLKDNSSARDNLNALNRCITKAREICEGVIMYCKNGDLTVNKEAVNVREVIDVTLECLPAYGSEIAIRDLTDKELILYANRACLLQLFQNLVDNAVKHSSAPTIEITLSGQHLENNYYEFHIHNNGWCSESIEQTRVFDAFYSDQSNGSGLGLMICKKIVTAYGGDIKFISSPENGTRISFSLPLYQANHTKVV